MKQLMKLICLLIQSPQKEISNLKRKLWPSTNFVLKNYYNYFNFNIYFDDLMPIILIER